MIGMRYPFEVNLVGDSARTLHELLTLVRPTNDRSWRDDIEAKVARWWEVMPRRAYTSADPINPELVFHELSQRLPDDAIIAADSGYAGYAKLLGLRGVTAEKPEDVVPAWEEALASDRPCVVEFRTDPAVPPIPPHASWDQIEKALESIIRGDSDRVGMIKEGFKSKVQEVLPGGKHPAGQDYDDS
ncbi:hypothetical protein [Kribbella pittospori]|uniref:hypothetical protein n=1 Tax=Kribbella pittospori TaxID=722689 RepID=UPI001EDE330E|nr:hypothetical protein [Kribbella pittospori]